MANTINFSNTTPAAPSGSTNVTWQNDSSTTPNVSAYVPTGLLPANNLSDVASAATARSNIGANNASNLTTGTLAIANGGTGAATAAAALTALGGASLTGTNTFAGSNTFTGSLLASGGFSAAIRAVTAATDTATSADYTVLCSAVSNAITESLPASPATGFVLNIKKTDSSTNAVTVSGNGHNIDGASTAVLTAQYQSISVQYDGTAWWIL